MKVYHSKKIAYGIAMAFFAAVCLILLIQQPVKAETSGDYEYTIVDGSYAVITKYNGTDANVTIPKEICGYPVQIIGERAFFECLEIENVTIPAGVTKIQPNAFNNCRSMTSVKIPNTVKSIGEYAFHGCESLVSAVIPEGITTIEESTFGTCYDLMRVTLPNSLTKIENNAFYACTSLTSIRIPDGVTSIGDQVFSNCGLSGVKVPDGVTRIGDFAFSGCSRLKSISLPDTVKSIGRSAFQYCYELRSIALPNGLTSIGECAFSHCTGLTQADIPNTVTKIDSHAFDGCCSLKKVTLPEHLTTIEDWTFASCNGLENVVIPNGVTTIKKYAFQSCNLGVLTLPSSVTDIYVFAFENAVASKIRFNGTFEEFQNIYIYPEGNTSFFNTPVYCTSDGQNYYQADPEKLIHFDYAVSNGNNATITNYKGNFKEVTIPSAIDGYLITEIGDNAFSENENLITLQIPDTVKKIGAGAFAGCTRLKNINLPKSLTAINNSTFFCCYVLDKITIPEGVTSIGSNAFGACYTLKSITLPKSLKSIGEDAFSGCQFTNIKGLEGVQSIGKHAFYDCAGLIDKILPVKPKTVNYNGKARTISKPKVKYSKGKVSYRYYIDQRCLHRTTKKNSGASEWGGAPVYPGIYYAKVKLKADGIFSKYEKIVPLEIRPKVTFRWNSYQGYDYIYPDIKTLKGVKNFRIKLYNKNNKLIRKSRKYTSSMAFGIRPGAGSSASDIFKSGQKYKVKVIFQMNDGEKITVTSRWMKK